MIGSIVVLVCVAVVIKFSKSGCKSNQIIALDGTCENCPSFMTASPDFKACQKPSVENHWYILSNGETEDCLPYTKPSKD